MQILVGVEFWLGPWAKYASSVTQLGGVDIQPAKQRNIINVLNFVDKNRFPLDILFNSVLKNFIRSISLCHKRPYSERDQHTNGERNLDHQCNRNQDIQSTQRDKILAAKSSGELQGFSRVLMAPEFP